MTDLVTLRCSMTFEEYLQIRALNWSTLKLIDTSPLALRDSLERPREDKPAFALGRALHCYVLERDKFEERYVCQPDFGDGRTKAAKEAKSAWFADCPPGADIVSADMFETIVRCGESISRHRVAVELLAGKREKTMTWIDPETGIACKGRADVASSGIVDLKSTAATTMHKLIMDATRLLYHGQCAWYHAGAVASGLIEGDRLPAAVFVQTVRPYDVIPMVMTQETYEQGESLCRDLITRYQGCVASDWWPGMAPSAIPWILPRWAKSEEI